MAMLKEELSRIEEHIRMLGNSSNALFELWDDNISHVFKDKCVESIKTEWRDYSSQMSSHMIHLQQMLKQIENNENNLKRIQDSY